MSFDRMNNNKEDFLDLQLIQGVIVDLDETLYGYDVCHEYAISQVQELLQSQLNITVEDFNIYYQSVKACVKRILGDTASSHNRLLYFQKLAEALGIKSTYWSLRLNNLYWDSYFEKMVLRPGVLQFLNYCKSHQVPICLLTDLNTEIQFKKIIRLKLENYIDYVVTSEEVLFDKPHPMMFFTALQKLQLRAHEVIMIGDSLVKDIEGASLLGIKTIWIKPSVEQSLHKKIDFIIEDFIDLEKKIWNL